MAEKKRAKNSARKKHDLRKSNIKKDITANFGIEEIKEEINREEERISKIEEEYYYDSDESDIYFE